MGWRPILSLVALLPLVAAATERATTSSGSAVRWPGREIVLRVAPPAASSGLSTAELVDTLGEAAEAWNTALRSCDAPRIRIGPPLDRPARVIEDGVDLVVLRSDAWCPERAVDREDCYDSRRSGITHLYPRHIPGDPRDGELREVDVEINGLDFAWSPSGRLPGTRSLRALLAHELGHVLGLDHPRRDAPGRRESIMYEDPVEPGRPEVLEPGEAEIQSLCETRKQPEKSSRSGRTGRL